MTCANPMKFVKPDNEIERAIHRRLSGATEGSTPRNVDIEDRESATMVEQRTTWSIMIDHSLQGKSLVFRHL